MRNLLIVSMSTILAVLFSGCPNNINPEYYAGVFPSQPVNFSIVNSEYDDYNSALPVINYGQYLYFSSNRNSSGENFDIVGDNLRVWWDMETGLLTIDNSQSYYDISFTDSLFDMMNTSANEFGPYAVNYWIKASEGYDLRNNLVTYSSNYESDSFKSKFVYYESDMEESGTFYGPFDIHMINSMNDAQYISFHFDDRRDNSDYWDLNPSKFDQMLFNANIAGNTDIFSIDLPENDNFVEMLKSDTVITPVRITSLNSTSEEKCPFVNAHLLVFTSDRPGGYGGWDLYYSWYENGAWSDPVNFGEEINTEYDEFRPGTMYVNDFVNDLMIFSSNRPGGKGGFDLYYVGLPFKIWEPVYIEE